MDAASDCGKQQQVAFPREFSQAADMLAKYFQEDVVNPQMASIFSGLARAQDVPLF